MRKREELSLTEVLNLEGECLAKAPAKWETVNVRTWSERTGRRRDTLAIVPLTHLIWAPFTTFQ